VAQRSQAVQPVALRVRLLGRFEVQTADGVPVRSGGRHSQALFTLLAMTQRPRSREAIAADLWPDDLAGANSPLRHALYQLRGSLSRAGADPDDVLESDSETLGLRASAVGELDVARFEQATRPSATDQELAISLYSGDFAEGLGHDCFAQERERLADRYEDCLAMAAAERLRDGDLEGARLAAERLLSRDPLREEGHAVLIGIFGQAGSRAQVVRQYRRVREVLARELGEPPLPETDAAYRLAMVQVVERSRQRAVAMARPDGPALAVVGG
jgi:DNA-binding SARP family transcriptional activator